MVKNGMMQEQKQKMFRALLTITIADISMSIDNVLAVAAIARENTYLLIFGLAKLNSFLRVTNLGEIFPLALDLDPSG